MKTKPMTRTAILFSLIASAFLLPATSLAATEHPPGYIDLSWIDIPADAVDVQDIDLTTLLTEVAASAEDEGESELARLLTMVHTLQIKGFTLPGDDTATRKAVERMETLLADDGWNRIVYVKDQQEMTSISVRRHEGRLVGLTVVTYEEGGQVGFINVTGKLDLDALLGLARHLNLSADMVNQAAADSALAGQ